MTTPANNALQTLERIATLVKKSEVGRADDGARTEQT